MKELGESSLEEHTKILKLIDDSDFDNVWLVGSEFGKALETHKCNKNDIITSFNEVAEVNAHITGNKPKGFTILIKGSNSTRLIETIEHL
jgi:UDP-N-acetylmuramoyl-tripeptide--D-alanyl-D-alanine ligase